MNKQLQPKRLRQRLTVLCHGPSGSGRYEVLEKGEHAMPTEEVDDDGRVWCMTMAGLASFRPDDLVTEQAYAAGLARGGEGTMKTVTYYECEACGARFSEADGARECEARQPPAVYPTGLLDVRICYGPNLAFAVAESTTIPGTHYASTICWACRDTGYGDSLGENRCGNGSYDPVPFDPAWLTYPPMQRLIGWLRANGVVPLAWINGQAVPLDTAGEGEGARVDAPTSGEGQRHE